jgi:hypothetical protein
MSAWGESSALEGMWIYAAYELRSRIAALDRSDDVLAETFRQVLRSCFRRPRERSGTDCLREVPFRGDLRHRCRRQPHKIVGVRPQPASGAKREALRGSSVAS